MRYLIDAIIRLAEKAAKDFAIAEKKTEVTWSGPRAIIAKNRVKLLLNLFLVAYGAIPRGGSLDITLENPETDAKFKIVAKGRLGPGEMIAVELASGRVLDSGAIDRLRAGGPDQLHSRKLRSFAEVAFQ